MAPRSSEAIFGSIVFDPANHVENAATVVQLLEQVALMGDQVANSSAEVAMMVQNLLRYSKLAKYDLPLYELLLLNMSEAAGPRPRAFRNLDYYQPHIQATMKERYPGYKRTRDYGMDSAENADIHLNTIDSVQGQVSVEAGEESDTRYRDIREELYLSNEKSVGALQALHAGNAINLSTADGVRRVEKAIAGMVNLTAIKNATEQQEKSWGQAATEKSLKIAVGERLTPPPYDTSAPGSVSYLPHMGS